jgi:hypothetical protein
MKLYMFQRVPLSIIRSFSLHTQQWYMSYSCRAAAAVYKPVWHIPLLSVQWTTPDDGQRNCPKHVEFHSKIKFEKLVRLVGFIIRKFVTMHGHMSRCTVTCHDARSRERKKQQKAISCSSLHGTTNNATLQNSVPMYVCMSLRNSS